MPYDSDKRRMAYLTRVIRHGKPKVAPRKPAPIVHGTLHAYSRRGCRCEKCRAVHAAHWREYRAKPKTWPNWAHGRVTTYGGGCRCEKCRAAKCQAVAAWRATHRKPKDTPIDRRRVDRLAYFRQRYQAKKAAACR